MIKTEPEVENHSEHRDEDTFRILVVTDTHLGTNSFFDSADALAGYMERDPIRGNDSFITWEECLNQAKNLNVCDFLVFITCSM